MTDDPPTDAIGRSNRRPSANPKDSIPLFYEIKGTRNYQSSLSRAADEFYLLLHGVDGSLRTVRVPAVDKQALMLLLHSLSHIASMPIVRRNGIVQRRSYVAIPMDHNAFGPNGQFPGLSARAFIRTIKALKLLKEEHSGSHWVEIVNSYHDPVSGLQYRTRIKPLKPFLDWMVRQALVFPWHPQGGKESVKNASKSVIWVNATPAKALGTGGTTTEEVLYPLDRPLSGDEAILPKLNARLARQSVELRLETYRQYERLYDYGQCRPKLVTNGSKRVYRQFRHQDGIAGRLYGHWVQSVPSQLRSHLFIDGKPTVELDYRSMQLVLLYAINCVPVPEVADLYAVEGMGHTREDMKLVLTMTVGSANKSEALSAISGELHRQGRNRTGRATRLYDAFWSIHAGVNPHTFSDRAAWMDLQKLDSDIALRVLAKLIQLGITAIPIHDSFIVQKQYTQDLRHAMASSFADMFPNTQVTVG